MASGDNLICKSLNLKIIKKKDIPKIFEDLFNSDTNTLSKGIVSLYKYIRTMYGNITREDVKRFLINQTNYQLTKQDTRKLNRQKLLQCTLINYGALI